MKREYYYFACSLPVITFDGEPPMSTEEFLADCQKLLHHEDYFLVHKLLSKDVIDYYFLQKIQKDHSAIVAMDIAAFQKGLRFNRSFRNEMAAYRAERAGKDPLKYIRGDRDPDPAITEIIHQAGKASDPLEADRIINKARWDFFDEMQTGHYFDLQFIILYGLKLMILERYHVINSDKGKAVFEEIKKMSIPQP